MKGERIFAVTDHAALTWSRTFQNINRRLLTWGLVFSAFPNMKIIHRARRVHSNIDPVSRLRRRLPPPEGPIDNEFSPLKLKPTEDPLCNMFDELGPNFEEKLLMITAHFAETELQVEDDSISVKIPLELTNNGSVEVLSSTSWTFSTLVQINKEKIKKWRTAYANDLHYSQVLASRGKSKDAELAFPQYHHSEEGLIYFEDSVGNTRLCIRKDLHIEVMKEGHDTITVYFTLLHTFRLDSRWTPDWYLDSIWTPPTIQLKLYIS